MKLKMGWEYSDKTSNMIFFDFGYRLGTIQMTYVHMKYVENLSENKILMRFYAKNGTVSNALIRHLHYFLASFQVW